MRKKVFWIVLCLVAALGACRTAPAPKVEPARACADWRWIGISRPGAHCPDPPDGSGWIRRDLFPDLKPPDDKSLNLPNQEAIEKAVEELERFCVYEIEDPNRSAADVPSLDLALDLERFDRDCAALSIAAEPSREMKTARLRDEIFPAQVGLGAPLRIDNEEGVRLAFLDTQPTSKEVPETQGDAPLHGFTLTRVAKNIVCPEGRCAAQITTRLALSIRDFDARKQGEQIEKDRGGYVGMQGDLARAIQDEVDAWQIARDGEKQRHLVLNLSLGWDGQLFDGLKEEQVRQMQAGTQAVYRALQYAAGYDALVVAAAGNQKRDPCKNEGPLLPAAWETRNDREEKPLVYAVGGVSSDGSVLVNARPGGMPRRAAFGVLPSQDGKSILVGSSVATTVVSSIAAVVWDSFPDLESWEVMKILDESGKELEDGEETRKADFWFDQTQKAPVIHWLSLCTALKAAYEEKRPAERFDCPLVPQAEDQTAGLLANPKAKGSCQPWVLPQPEDDPCPICPPKKN